MIGVVVFGWVEGVDGFVDVVWACVGVGVLRSCAEDDGADAAEFGGAGEVIEEDTERVDGVEFGAGEFDGELGF